MSVSQDQVVSWCNQLVEKSPDFPSLEDCLQVIPTLDALADLPAGTRVLVRGDTDVVVHDDGTISDDVRIRSLLETLKFGCERGWVQIVYGHRGRDPQLSLEPVAKHLEALLKENGISDKPVAFVGDWLNDETGEVCDCAGKQVADLEDGTVVVLENTRKYQMEQLLWKAKPADIDAAAERITAYANTVAEKLATVHVNEGFASSNRDLSSTVVPLTMEQTALGRYIEGELHQHVTKTRLAELVIFSGLKANKLDDLEQILNRKNVRMVVAAGSLAMALKKADAEINDDDFCIGLASDPEQKIYIAPERIAQAKRMLETGRSNGVEFVLPVDFVLSDGTVAETIPADGAQFDIGPATSELQAQKVGEFIAYHESKLAADNGPAYAFHNGVFGKFEDEEFSHGTRKFVDQLKRMKDAGVQVYVGGGEGGAALMRYGDESWVTHCFTAGGTILKALGAEPIPYLKALTLKTKVGS